MADVWRLRDQERSQEHVRPQRARDVNRRGRTRRRLRGLRMGVGGRGQGGGRWHARAIPSNQRMQPNSPCGMRSPPPPQLSTPLSHISSALPPSPHPHGLWIPMTVPKAKITCQKGGAGRRRQHFENIARLSLINTWPARMLVFPSSPLPSPTSFSLDSPPPLSLPLNPLSSPFKRLR